MKKLLLSLAVLLSSAMASAQTATDSLGVYAVMGDSIRTVTPVMHTKMGMGLNPRFTFPGTTSPHHFKDKAVLLLYLGMPKIGMPASYEIFATSTLIEHFAVSRLHKKKDRRTIGMLDATFQFKHAKKGLVKADEGKVYITMLRPGVYRIEVDAAPGEYGIFSRQKTSGWNTVLFDFTIDK